MTRRRLGHAQVPVAVRMAASAQDGRSCAQNLRQRVSSAFESLFEQLRRAAISVEANIVEGYALESTLQFRKHLRIAMGSAAEAECLVRAASELNYLSTDVGAELENLLGGTMRVLRGLLRLPIKPQPGS